MEDVTFKKLHNFRRALAKVVLFIVVNALLAGMMYILYEKYMTVYKMTTIQDLFTAIGTMIIAIAVIVVTAVFNYSLFTWDSPGNRWNQ